MLRSPGTSTPSSRQPGHQPQRHLVVGDDDRRWVLPVDSNGAATVGGESSAGLCRPVTGPALRGREAVRRRGRASNPSWRDASSSQSEGPPTRPIRRCPRATRWSTTSDDAVGLPVRRTAVHDDDRQSERPGHERVAGTRVRRDQHDPVDALPQDVGHGGVDGRLVRRVGVRRGDPPTVSRAQRQRAPRSRRSGRSSVTSVATTPERPGRRGAERPGRIVGAVVELDHGLEHPLAGVLAQVRRVVEHAGHGLGRHAGEAGDLAHADAAHRRGRSLRVPSSAPPASA